MVGLRVLCLSLLAQRRIVTSPSQWIHGAVGSAFDVMTQKVGGSSPPGSSNVSVAQLVACRAYNLGAEVGGSSPSRYTKK